jgi:hypothetical protein
MIPQLGISLLERLGITKGKMLDPYCGSGSSFAVGVHVGMKHFFGYDLNPLAVLITRAKFTQLDEIELQTTMQEVLSKVSKSKPASENSNDIPEITNIDYWFPREGMLQLVSIKRIIDKVANEDLRNLFSLALSETIRDVSYTRKNEFKLYRIPPEKMDLHNPDVPKIFGSYLEKICQIYLTKYLPKLAGVKALIQNQSFDCVKSKVDVLLTSPPYGDSRTTVAYGQFSTLTNEWLGIENARKIDSQLMGGRRVNSLLEGSVISDQLREVSDVDPKRALEVSSFYEDLGQSIRDVSRAVNTNGYSIYVVGNRRVKDVQLQTDQFIAEEFERSGFEHVITYERLISSKSMPASNSPSNKSGVTRGTMTQEFVVVSRKKS